jgi:hypothetical protein
MRVFPRITTGSTTKASKDDSELKLLAYKGFLSLTVTRVPGGRF